MHRVNYVQLLYNAMHHHCHSHRSMLCQVAQTLHANQCNVLPTDFNHDNKLTANMLIKLSYIYINGTLQLSV